MIFKFSVRMMQNIGRIYDDDDDDDANELEDLEARADKLRKIK